MDEVTLQFEAKESVSINWRKKLFIPQPSSSAGSKPMAKTPTGCSYQQNKVQVQTLDISFSETIYQILQGVHKRLLIFCFPFSDTYSTTFDVVELVFEIYIAMLCKPYKFYLIFHTHAVFFFSLIIPTKRIWMDFSSSCIDFRSNIAVFEFPWNSDTSENKLFGTH